MATTELDAELPPLQVRIDLHLANGTASLTWRASDGRRGMAAGPPSEVAAALAAVVRRLSGVPVPAACSDAPTRSISRV